jgi:hypothetical protein
VSSDSGFRLLDREGSGVATACPVAPCGTWASSIKKSLAGLPTQPGSPIPNACTHVPKAADARVIIGLQDMRADDTFKAYKTCEHVATVRLQCSDKATVVPCDTDSTGPYHEPCVAGRQDMTFPMLLKTSFAYS